MGGVSKTFKSVVQHPARALAAGFTGGLSEAAQQDPFGAPLPFRNPLNVGLNAALHMKGDSQGISGPFSLDPNQFAGDRKAINDLGDQQYADTLQGIGDISTANTTRAQDLFKQMLPDIAENAQTAHLYDSTGYGQEVARQQSDIASQIANQEAQQKFSALQGKQGFQSGALQRGLSLEDFVNQANVAKTIGAQSAPQAPSGKQNFGTVAEGVGALAPWANVGKAGNIAGAGKK